ncbi:hypothetical protein AOC36_10560 [Erysipelothrix larvae]|uniref:HTH merR-type domain-containing protein n=1 Tax=Erysipelothrix larvae TaxID=1514105 RepID=A0A109UHK8_9FIRM|nr:MerR family transcriptional regulator [Erysipelothrix larvae]AMC94396.1 hypothetical protein AOC36_10560 [Erysipelothrix larvae]
MNIQEVSKRTQLSDKTIRYYESIGLIRIKRKDNRYREYTQSDVKKLNAIRLMRYVSISIEDIKRVMENPELWHTVMNQYKHEFEKMQKEDEKKRLLFDVLNESSYEALFDQSEHIIETLHDEDLFELIDYIKSPSLFSTIISTLILSGPVLGLILVTYTDVTFSNQQLLVPFALFTTILLTVIWVNYYKNRNPKLQRSNSLVSIVLFVVALIVVFAIFIIATLIQEKLILTPQSILYTHNILYLNHAFIGFTVIQVLVIIFGVYYSHKKDMDFEIFNECFKVICKYWTIVVSFNLIFLYIFFTSVSVVNVDGSIVRFSALNPRGTHVDVASVNRVSVGFTDGFFKQYKPEFSMVLTTDQFSIDIGGANFVSGTSDTYVELELLDTLYMSKGIQKIVKNQDVSACTIDIHYCNRFMRIIKNQ